ncbi:MAG: hypothetical protein MUF73_01955 [Rhodobacteraceae bacterium]|jgi:hypothetical protein|nr:hypothetical protein [Paracoccaceae bacterium]
MPERTPNIDRAILVFTIWGSLGFLGLGIILEGLARDRWLVSVAGIAVIIAAFGAHIVVNALHRTGFTRGETALGIGVYGILGLVFVVGALMGGMTQADFHIGLTLLGTLAVGFVAYLVTRHGLRGAFSQFHVRAPDTATRRGA